MIGHRYNECKAPKLSSTESRQTHNAGAAGHARELASNSDSPPVQPAETLLGDPSVVQRDGSRAAVTKMTLRSFTSAFSLSSGRAALCITAEEPEANNMKQQILHSHWKHQLL